MFNKSLLVLFICSSLLTLVTMLNFNHISANSDYYPMACPIDEYEVSYIENDGSLTKVSCHSHFENAINKMKENDDYVVRYSKSYSPSKIVAMNSGLAYSYPGRSGSITMNVYQNYKTRLNDSKYKYTYITNHYEMTYIDTLGPDAYDIKTNGKGYVKVVLNGFEGYTDLEYTDLVPRKYLDNNIAIWLGGNNEYEDEDPFLVKTYQNYYQIEKNGNYYDLVLHYHRAYSKNNGQDCLKYSLNFDNGQNYLDAGMKTNTKYYSNDGINFYSDPELKNFVAKVYNYYKFLPLRSKTNITATNLDSFLSHIIGNSEESLMRNTGSFWIECQNKYGCNALLSYAMACLESSYGSSPIALASNNIFGWAAVDSNPGGATEFESVKEDIRQQMGRYLNWYMDYTNTRYYGTCLGNKGAGFGVMYSSDPYWAEKISELAYSIDKYANNKNGKLSDYNSYTIGFVKDNYNNCFYSSNPSVWDSNIYKQSNGNDILYTARYGSNYQKDLTVIVLGLENNRYKIQSTNSVRNDEIVTDDGLIDYDFNSSVGYIDKDKVILLNNKVIEPEYEHEALTLVDNIKFENNKLFISGIGLISNYNFTNNDDIKHKINIYSLTNNQLVSSINCENTDTSFYNLNDGFSYKYAGFETNIDVTELNNDTYIFKLVTSINNESKETILTSYEKSLSLRSNIYNQKEYKISCNDIYNYRFELDINKYYSEIDSNKINKSTIRSSFVTLDDICLNEETQKIEFKGIGMIYYLNYDNINNIEHNLYLINDDEIIKLDTQTSKSYINLQELYASEYNMDYVFYNASIDPNNLNGNYKLVLEIINDNYKDYCEITNDYNIKYHDIEFNDKNISFLNSPIRNRLIMSIN